MNEETREVVNILVADIYELTMSYTLATTVDLKKKHLEAIEIKAMELKAFIRNARDNDAI